MNGNRIQQKLIRNKETVAVYLIFIVVFVLFSMSQVDFYSAYGLQSLFNQSITLSVAALAQTMVLLVSGIDLSIGALIGLTNSVLAVTIMPFANLLGGWTLGGEILAILFTLCVGAVAGLINGFFIVKMRLQSIIVTLATSSVFLGIGMYILPNPGGKVPISFATFLTGFTLNVIPVSAIIILLIIVCWIFIRRSRLGQSIYAVGGSEYSAYISGVDVERTKMIAFILSGVFSACAGILVTAQTTSGDPQGAMNFTINTISASVMGGIALSGGKGSYLGTLAGAFILSMVLGLLIFWSISSFYQDVVQGGILLLVLVLTSITGKRRMAKQ